MKSKYFIIGIISASISFHAYSQNLELDIINFLEKYETYSSFTKDGLSFEPAYEDEFIRLFRNLKLECVFNDLGLKVDSAVLAYTPSNYTKKVKGNFDFGINVTLEILNIGTPKKAHQGYYDVPVIAKKSMYYLSKEKKIQQKEYELVITISCKKAGEEYRDLKIKEIKNKNASKQTSWFNMGLLFQSVFSNIRTEDWKDLHNGYGSWEQSGNFSFNGGVEVDYLSDKPFKNFGIRIQYSSYVLDACIDIFQQQPIKELDRDNEEFILRLDGSKFEEKIKISYMEIPLIYILKIPLGSSATMKNIFIKTGPVLSFQINNSFEGNGIARYRGYYANYHAEFYDIPLYDFYENVPYQSVGESALKGLNLSALIEAGINLPFLSKKFNVNISAISTIGLLNLSDREEKYLFSEKYGSYSSLVDSREILKTLSFGLNLGLNYCF